MLTFHPWQVSRQPAAIAGSVAGLAVGLAPDDRFALFMGGVEHALGDLHVLQSPTVLIGAQSRSENMLSRESRL